MGVSERVSPSPRASPSRRRARESTCSCTAAPQPRRFIVTRACMRPECGSTTCIRPRDSKRATSLVVPSGLLPHVLTSFPTTTRSGRPFAPEGIIIPAERGTVTAAWNWTLVYIVGMKHRRRRRQRLEALSRWRSQRQAATLIRPATRGSSATGRGSGNFAACFRSRCEWRSLQPTATNGAGKSLS